MTKRRTAAQVRAERRRVQRAEVIARRVESAQGSKSGTLDALSRPELGLFVRDLKSGPQFRWSVPLDDPVDVLEGITAMRAGLAALEVAAVRIARDDGLSWDDIGFWLGVSGQAASKRLQPAVDLASQTRRANVGSVSGG